MFSASLKGNTTELVDDEAKDIWSKQYPILSTQAGCDKLHTRIYITTALGDPHSVIEIVEVLKAAKEQDTVEFILSTPGGDAYTAMFILDAILTCQASIHGRVVGDVASAGTMLLMAMDTIEVSTWGSIMIHAWSGSNGVLKANEHKARYKFDLPHFESFFRDVYDTFLSSDEIESVLAGTDIFMARDEILQRWESVMAARKAQTLEYLKEEEKRLAKEEFEKAQEVIDKWSGDSTEEHD